MSLYSVFDYGSMIADRVRMDAYIRALRAFIRPDSVVLDIGTGTGIFALLACQMGARRVYAVEPDDSIQLAKDLAVANGFADHIVFFQKLSTEVTLPERADVIVSDLGGRLPWFQHHIPSIVDARQRLLVPGGALIPQRDSAWAAAVEAPEFYARYTDGWNQRLFGLDMAAARKIALNTPRRFSATPEQLLTPPQRWAVVDYATVTDPSIQAEMSLPITRAGVAHGFSLWFDRELAHDVELSNAPGMVGPHTPTIYGGLFFPLRDPLTLQSGDSLSLTLSARLVGEDYIWRWDTRAVGAPTGTSRQAQFKQSTFFSVALTVETLRRRSATYRPQINDFGQIDRLILSQMDGTRTLADIADTLIRQFPQRFNSWHTALSRVSDFAQRYSR